MTKTVSFVEQQHARALELRDGERRARSQQGMAGGSHEHEGVDLVTWLMRGAEPETVTAVLQTLKPETYPRVDDEATLILTYPRTQAIIQGSWNWPVGRKDMEIYGERGYLVAVDDLTIRMRMLGDRVESALTLPPAPERVSDPFNYLSAVVRGVEKVAPGNLWSLENALTVVKILDAARESAREGKTIQL